jgi:hypothetical protein
VLFRVLAEKNHVCLDPKWALVELIPDLYMDRVYEDHENLVKLHFSILAILFMQRSLPFSLCLKVIPNKPQIFKSILLYRLRTA